MTVRRACDIVVHCVVDASHSGGSSQEAKIGLGVGLGVGLFLLIVIIIIVIWCCSKFDDAKSATASTLSYITHPVCEKSCCQLPYFQMF